MSDDVPATIAIAGLGDWVPRDTADGASKAKALSEFELAAQALRDTELAMKAAQERYRHALIALNQAVAPLPEQKP